MMPDSLSAVWATIASGIANHLWQSTVFAILAGFLTLVLRKNQARARYGLWFAASVKFLVPFSLLIGIGSHLATVRGPAPAKTSLYVAMQQVSQPFTQSVAPTVPSAVHATGLSGLAPLLPVFLVTVWFCGFAVVFFRWSARWRHLSVAMREAIPLREGREWEALRRLERKGDIRKPIKLVLSRGSLEPGIFGIFRTVLLWPEGVSQHLEEAHLEAILAHEICHVRRRDNLTAAIHMFVEAVFWFHPLVWWLGARLIQEREGACDEEVLQLGSEPQVYAESILKVCEFCLGSPLACVSGVTGADLRKRIVDIMTNGIVYKLDFSKKLLLLVLGLTTAAVPIVVGQINAAQAGTASPVVKADVRIPPFDVISIKANTSGGNMFGMMATPDGFTATSVSLSMLLQNAYGIKFDQISGLPDWGNSARFDIAAKVSGADVADLQKLSHAQRLSMLRSILAERFNLKTHNDTKELPIYELLVAKTGSKLKVATPDANQIKDPNGVSHTGMMMRMGPGELTLQGATMSSLANLLAGQVHRTVVDKTGLTEHYDLTLKFTPEEGSFLGPLPPDGGPQKATPPPDDTSPSIFTALEEQLGLRLQSSKGPVDILVIDHVESPSEN